MAIDDETLDQHAQRRREILLRARGLATAGPALALVLEGGLMPKRAAAYTTASATQPIVTTTPPAVTGTGGFLTDRCGAVAQF